jgi:phosphatidate cytidylyltransferase
VSDWRDDEYDDEPRSGGEFTAEGVRILGSESAPSQRPSFAAGDDEFDTWSAAAEGSGTRRGDPSGAMPLPHWTDPPTGEVPRFLEDDTSDDLESWTALTGNAPRFRTDAGAWAAGDFEAGELAHDDSTLVGALDETPPADPYDDAPPSRRARREARESQSAGRGRRGRGAPERGGGMHAEPDPTPEPPLVSAPTGSLEGQVRPTERPRPNAGARGADTSQRVITGAVAGAIAVVAFALGRVPTLVLITALVAVGAAELYEAFRRAGYHTATLVGLLGCVAIVPLAYDQGTEAFPMMIFLVGAVSVLWYLFEVMRARPVVNVALTLMVFVYVGCFAAFAGLFLAADQGVGYVLGVVLCVVAYDVVGWFVGSTMGRSPLLPRVSPNKTMEGLVGGMVAAFVMGILVVNFVSGWKRGDMFDGVVLGLVVAIAAPLGDLVESMIKRDLGVKDLGTLLPGHGGVLDRVDALLFTLPAAYYVAIHIVS